MNRLDEAPRPARRSLPLTTIFVVFVLAACARGVFELYSSKQVGYVVQAGAVMVLVVAALLSSSHRRARDVANVVALYAFATTAIASAAYTLQVHPDASPWVYVVVMFTFCGAIYVFASRSFPTLAAQPLLPVLAFAGVLLVSVATAQQFTGLLQTLPGSDQASMQGLVRPASLTGSYLHYPLALAVLAFIFLQAFSVSRSRAHLLLAVVFVVATLTNFSRSGALIVALCALFFLALTPSTRKRVTSIYALVSLGFLGLLAFGDSVYAQRIIGAASLDAAGNSSRVELWANGLHMWWAESPVLIGGFTGMVTNSTRNISGAESTVVESGLLQQLVNFGLLGTAAFYVLLFAVFFAVPSRHVWLRAGILACIAQTIVYQSVEVFPFMALLVICPLISHHLDVRYRRVMTSTTAVYAE